jgi:glycosyltransferase involved in cell wall biosynthesis
VRTLEDGDGVRWIGSVTGAAKHAPLGRARALLCAIRWDEPGGTAVCEALACGTPVVAMRRGVMPRLIDHGVSGFLADDEAEFAALAGRVEEIDPAACRRADPDACLASLCAGRHPRQGRNARPLALDVTPGRLPAVR